MPMNQSSQKGCVAAKSVRQTQACWFATEFGNPVWLGAWTRREGTETRAERVFLMVRERRLSMISVMVPTVEHHKRYTYCHSTADNSDLKLDGRLER